MLDVALRCSSIAESSSNIESVISVHVGGSGASDAVAFVELLVGDDLLGTSGCSTRRARSR